MERLIDINNGGTLADVCGWDTKHIRYSTTQGTNALVERKGLRIGLITDDVAVLDELASDEELTAEDRLRSHRVKNPLLIYRNDGAPSRVAKSVASTRETGPTMLSAALGMLAMLPVVFGVSGYVMVSR